MKPLEEMLINPILGNEEDSKECREKLFNCNMSDFTSEIYQEIAEQVEKTRRKNMIDDIILIYHNYYETYDKYLEKKKELTELVRAENDKLKKTFFEGKPCNLSFTLYIDPVILDKEIFDYICDKGKELKHGRLR